MVEKREKTEYTTVSIPKALGSRIDEAVGSKKFGYQNRADFVMEAIRRRLRELGMLEETSMFQALSPDEKGVQVAELKGGKIIRVAQITFSSNRILCEYDGEEPCEHKSAALDSPEVQENGLQK